jgi:fluoroacetyl-CoA thioesterase
MAIEVGLTAEVEQVVTQELTADALGNKGVKVFATPYVVSLMETAAQAAIVSHLPPGAGTVGTTVEMKHLAATPLGMKVRAKATLVETDGKRCLFQVDVFDEVEKIADGRHERFIVPNLEKFLARAMSKGRSAS